MLFLYFIYIYIICLSYKHICIINLREFQVGIRSITSEGREQGKKFGVEQYEMRTFSRDRQVLENLVSLSPSHTGRQVNKS